MLSNLLRFLADKIATPAWYYSERFTKRVYGKTHSPISVFFWRASTYLNYLWFRIETPELEIFIDKHDSLCWKTASKRKT